MESNITKLRQYSDAIDVDDFVDYEISINVLDKKAYCDIWQKPERHRLNEVFNHIDKKGYVYVELTLQYLARMVPNIDEINEDERNFRRSSVRGSLPKLPPNYIRREKLAEQIKQKLQNLTWDKKLVIYGMMGYGKSCLVNEVLNDKILRKYFDNNVFWVNLGEYHNENNVLQPMWRLYSSASSTSNKIHCPDDVQILKELLRELFLEKRLSNALLILDDVCNANVLDFFDIGCKTVITTQDKNILGREEAIFVEVKTGFTLNETLKLFKLSLNTDKDLPTEAEDIYTICKGHPMLIALIGSYLNENMNNPSFVGNNAIWDYVKIMFLRGEYRLNEYNDEAIIPSEIVRKCVDNLLANNHKLKSRYEDLAIFLQDVNIPPEVLEVLWNTNYIDVTNTMNKFAEKSLIVPFYHNDLQRFIYGIHDIHLNYLNEETRGRIRAIHRRLISGYDQATNKDYSLLPDDNYSLHFIGYHLYKAELFDRFSIYFDLGFLEAKIRAVGKEDLLRDMVEYEACITEKDDMLKCKLTQYKEFIRRHGANIFNFPKTDIIQYALQEEKSSYVFQAAFGRAHELPNLYFKYLNPIKGDLDYFESIPVKDDITCASFVDSPQHILVGCTNGKIKLFYEQYEKEISSFVGHTSAVVRLAVSPDKSHFLSIGEDGVVFLWKFSADSKRNSMDLKQPVSPKTTQREWKDIFRPESAQIKPKRKFQVDKDALVSACFPSDFPLNNRIATGSKTGNCVVWDAESGLDMAETRKRGYEVPCVSMSQTDLIFAYDDIIEKYKITSTPESAVKLDFFGSLHNRDKVGSFFLNDREIIAVSDSSINVWDANPNNLKMEAFTLEKGLRNTCVTLTNDSKYLIVSTDRNTVCFWDVQERRSIRQFENKGLAKSLDTFYDENNSVHILLIGSDRKTLQQCHVQPCDKEPLLNNSPLFIPYWKKKRPLIPLISQPENKIQVFRGYTLISESDSIGVQVTRICLSVCGNNIIYGLSNGELHTFNIKSRQTIKLASIANRGAITFLKCFDPNNSFVGKSRMESTSSSNGSLVDYNLNNEYYNGLIVAVCERNFITVHTDEGVLCQPIKKPTVFLKSGKPILVDQHCQIYKWDLAANQLALFETRFNSEEAVQTSATFCEQKDLLGVTYIKENNNLLDVLWLEENEMGNGVNMKKRIALDGSAKCSLFSPDGSLLAVGLTSGYIYVWSILGDFKLTKLQLHSDSVEQLLFSPSMEPILVSVSEEVAWWNLKPLKKVPPLVRGRPGSIEILDSVNEEMHNMNIGFWCDRTLIDKNNYLLSCLRLHAKAKFISASNDFKLFLMSDEKGKIYIMEAIQGDADQICSI